MEYEKYCACGCGTELIKKKWWKPSNYPRYIRGHWLKGENNPNWVGGEIPDSYGYILVLKHDHPFANNNGYVRKHRLVYEEYYNCILLPWVVIDHLNGIKTDNRIENLEVKTQSDHMSRHFKKDFNGRFCSICGSDKTRIIKHKNEKLYENWYGDKETGLKCDKCHEREYRLSGKRKENKLKKLRL